MWPSVLVVELFGMERMVGGKVAGRRLRWWLALGLVLNPVTVLVVSYFTLFPTVGIGTSMEPTWTSGTVSFKDQISLRFERPARGDIVSFDNPWESRERLGKRVIGLPGERFMMVRGVVFIDGEKLVEPYVGISYDRTWDNTEEFTLGPDEYWVMGDNRGVSFDSRYFGPVDGSEFEARDTGWVIWPPSAVTAPGALIGGAVLAAGAALSVGFGRAAGRKNRAIPEPRPGRAWGWLLWAFGYWVVAKHSTDVVSSPNGEVWRVPRPLWPLPPPPSADETPIPDEEPVGVVIVGPKLGLVHFLPFAVVVAISFYGYVPGELGTVLGALVLTWMGWFDVGAPRARNVVESLAVGIACGLVGLALRSQFGAIGTMVFIAATVGLAVVLWRGRERRTGRRFAALQATPGATLNSFELSTRELRPGDLERLA